jgi:hypothetical protein
MAFTIFACTKWLSSQMMIQTGYSTHFGFCDICRSWFMSKVWFCSGWFGLYLTPAPRWFCCCRGLLLCWAYACPAPPCKPVMLELVLWWFWTGWTAVLFFLFLCSCNLLAYPAACRWVAGSGGGKGFIWTLLCSPGRQQGLATLGDSLLVCVLCSMHTALWAGCVCVYTWCFAPGLGLGCELISSATVDHILQIFISF